MVLVKHAKLLFSLLLILLLFNCNEKIFTDSVDCEYCYADKPASVYLELSLTINGDFTEIPVLLYEGTTDKGKLIDTFYCTQDISTVAVASDRYYSAKAIYKSGDKTTMVFDGIQQTLKHVTGVCDPDCWVIENIELSLKLKE